MTFKVKITVTVPQSHEVPSGIYLNQSITLSDRLLGKTLEEIKSLLADMKEYDLS